MKLDKRSIIFLLNILVFSLDSVLNYFYAFPVFVVSLMFYFVVLIVPSFFYFKKYQSWRYNVKTEFACVIKCMDGRIQNVVSAYMRKKFNVPYIDAITVAGPVKVLAENKKDQILNDLKFR